MATHGAEVSDMDMAAQVAATPVLRSPVACNFQIPYTPIGVTPVAAVGLQTPIEIVMAPQKGDRCVYTPPGTPPLR